MAAGKVRALHPDFFSDDDVAEVSIPARLLFAGLWCFACDNGHIPNRSKQIKRWIYATDDVNCAELLRELVAIGLVEVVDEWLVIPNLAKRQRIDFRYFKKCDREGCEKPRKGDSEPETLRGNMRPQRAPAGGTRGPVADGDGDGDGVFDGDSDGDVTRVAAPKKATRKAAQRPLPSDWQPTAEHLKRGAETGVFVAKEAEKFRLHAEAHDRRAANWNAAFTSWLIKAVDFAAKDAPKPRSPLPTASQLEEPPPGLNAEQYAAWFAEQVAKRKAAGQ